MRYTFPRTVDTRLMNLWLELEQIASSIQYTDDDDVIICQFESSGRYSVRSMYVVISNRR
jgi:hypothetical protein